MSCEPLVHEQAVSVGLQGVRQQLMNSVARIQNKNRAYRVGCQFLLAGCMLKRTSHASSSANMVVNDVSVSGFSVL